ALKFVKLLGGKPWGEDGSATSIVDWGRQRLLQAHVNSLFTIEKKAHDTNIMVTRPDEAVDDLDLLKDLMSAGMKIARINRSQGDRGIWEQMLANIRQASESLGLSTIIYMDLPGPKIRVSDRKSI